MQSEADKFTQLQDAIVKAEQEKHTLESKKSDAEKELNAIMVEFKVKTRDELEVKLEEVKKKIDSITIELITEAKGLGLIDA